MRILPFHIIIYAQSNIYSYKSKSNYQRSFPYYYVNFWGNIICLKRNANFVYKLNDLFILRFILSCDKRRIVKVVKKIRKNPLTLFNLNMNVYCLIIKLKFRQLFILNSSANDTPTCIFKHTWHKIHFWTTKMQPDAWEIGKLKTELTA